MEKDGYVSLWVGNIESEEDFSEYMKIIYNDDGDAVSSMFSNDFQINIDDFDEDFIECIFSKNKTQSLIKIIKNCSYEDTILL
ncbi:MAG: immunity 22 family protein, partial [Oscillospiraceae bacterium]|nr:immunity 22 family protein [Oscillospiraceae bacterium]